VQNLKRVLSATGRKYRIAKHALLQERMCIFPECSFKIKLTVFSQASAAWRKTATCRVPRTSSGVSSAPSCVLPRSKRNTTRTFSHRPWRHTTSSASVPASIAEWSSTPRTRSRAECNAPPATSYRGKQRRQQRVTFYRQSVCKLLW